MTKHRFQWPIVVPFEWLERLAVRYVIKRLRWGYGADCPESDLDDFRELYTGGSANKAVMHRGRCPSCRAEETIYFLEEHDRLIKSVQYE